MCCSVVFSQLKSLEFCSGFSVSTKVLPLTISYDGPQEDLKNNDGSHNDNDKKKKKMKKKKIEEEEEQQQQLLFPFWGSSNSTTR